jgi:hypothetical protein
VRCAVWALTVIRVIAGLVLLANVLVGRARLLGLIADSARQSGEARSVPAQAAPPPTEKNLDDLWGRLAP